MTLLCDSDWCLFNEGGFCERSRGSILGGMCDRYDDTEYTHLKEENEKLRELIRKAVSLASEHCEPYQPCDGVCDSWDDVVIQEDGKPTRFTCEMGVIYGVMEDLGIEPKL